MSYLELGREDAKYGEPYKRAPGNRPPRVSPDKMPQDWRDYFNGYRSASTQGSRRAG